MLLFLHSACTDYNLYSNKDPDDVNRLPEIEVYPPQIDAGIVCEEKETSFRILNQGDAGLTVTGFEIQALEILGENWELLDVSVPFDLAPNGYRDIRLNAAPGEALLSIESTDPERSVLSVPLLAVLDQPPSLEIITPYEGQTLSGTEIFQAVVSDDVDPPEYLMSQWHSNIDGLFSSDAPRVDGTLEAIWTPAHAVGMHSIRAMVVDSCRNSTVEYFQVCQQGEEQNASIDISTWNFEGSARWDNLNDWVELTPLVQTQAGSAFAVSETVNGSRVDIEFLFYMSDGTGADGISVTALDTARMTSFFGGTGGGIGYKDLPGWSIEVDNYYNQHDPTAEDHLTFTFDGDIYGPEVWVPLPNMEDGSWHQMKVSVRAPRVYVEIDQIVYLDQDIEGFYDFDAYVGFTGATGSLTNRHLIDSLVVTEQICGD